MRNGTAIALRLSSGALVFSGYLALAATRHYGPPIILVPLVFLPLAPIGEWLDSRYAFYQRLTSGLTVMCACLLFISYMLFLSLLDAVTALIIYIQIHTLVHRKQTRNYHYLFLMAFFLLLVACVLSPEARISVAMFLFLMSATWAFLTLQIYAESERNRERTVPDIIALGAQGARAIPESRGIFDFGLLIATTLVGVGALFLTIAFFVLTPRFEAGLLGRGGPGQFQTGLNQTVDLTQVGRITLDPTPVMRVEFPEEPGGRYSGPLFWRCSTLDSYADGVWARRGVSSYLNDRLPRMHPRNVASAHTHQQALVVRNPKGTGRLVHQAIYMDDVPVEGVPGLALVQKMQCSENPKDVKLSWDGMGDFTVVMARRGTRRLQYEVWSEVDNFTTDQLRRARVNYRDVLSGRDFFRLTNHTIQDRTRRLIQEITAGHTTVYDKIVAIERWLREEGGFSYTLDLPQLDRQFPIDDFIHTTKRGHCELFASAMALMLRSIGIPTRVVIGYRGGEWNPTDQSCLVRASMAHLWVEVYFLDHGWLTFDPSPPSDELRGFATGRFARALSRYILKAKMRWYSRVIAYDRGLQLATLRTLGRALGGFGSGLFHWGEDAPVADSRLPGVSLRVFLIVAVLGALFMVLLQAHRLFRRPKYILTVDQARAVRLFKRLCRKLTRFGVDCRGRTAEEIQDDIVECPVIVVAPAADILTTYNAVRFGARPLPPDHYARLRKSLRVIRRGRRFRSKLPTASRSRE